MITGTFKNWQVEIVNSLNFKWASRVDPESNCPLLLRTGQCNLLENNDCMCTAIEDILLTKMLS